MRKKRPEVLHTPSTIDIFHSISSNPEWAQLLIGRGKEYDQFLKNLIEHKFYEDENQRRTIKSIAEQTGFPTIKVTKWINKIYKDIF